MEHMVGPQTHLRAVCIGPEDDIERRQREIAAAAKSVDMGHGVIIATDNAGYVDHNPFPSHDRKADAGYAVALVRGAGAGSFKVEATAEGLKPATVSLRATNTAASPNSAGKTACSSASASHGRIPTMTPVHGSSGRHAGQLPFR
jgi:hypothetical protein